jgi:hypothetical protein
MLFFTMLLYLIIYGEMIFVQLFFNNFWTIFSLILLLYSYSISSFRSLSCFYPKRKKKNKVVSILVV